MAKRNKGSKAAEFSESDPERTNVDAASDAEAEAGAASGKKTYKKYPTMIIGLGKTRKELHGKATALADKLGCKVSDLVWVGLERVVAEPPKDAPKGATINAGTAAGFWVVPVMPANGGRATGVEVLRVDSRSAVNNGRTFFRYDRNDEKSKARAQKQAVAAAEYDAKILGLKADAVKVKEGPKAS